MASSFRRLDHSEARGQPRTLVENRRIAAATAEELGSNDLQKLKGSDLDAFCDRLTPRGLSATTRPVQRVGAGMIPIPWTSRDGLEHPSPLYGSGA